MDLVDIFPEFVFAVLYCLLSILQHHFLGSVSCVVMINPPPSFNSFSNLKPHPPTLKEEVNSVYFLCRMLTLRPAMILSMEK